MLPSGCGTTSFGEFRRLPLNAVGDDGDRTVKLVADHAASQVLAGYLPALEVERVAVAVVRRHAEHRDLAVVFQPAKLTVIGDVAPDEIAALGVPGRPLRPQRACPQACDRAVRLRVTVEQRIHREHVGIGEICGRRSLRTEVARWRGDGAGRRHLHPLRKARASDDGSGPDADCQAGYDAPSRHGAGLRTALCLVRHDCVSSRAIYLTCRRLPDHRALPSGWQAHDTHFGCRAPDNVAGQSASDRCSRIPVIARSEATRQSPSQRMMGLGLLRFTNYNIKP